MMAVIRAVGSGFYGIIGVYLKIFFCMNIFIAIWEKQYNNKKTARL